MAVIGRVGSNRLPFFPGEEDGAGEPSQPGLFRSTSPEPWRERSEQDNRQDEQRDPGPDKENRVRPTCGDARDLEKLADVQQAKCGDEEKNEHLPDAPSGYEQKGSGRVDQVQDSGMRAP